MGFFVFLGVLLVLFGFGNLIFAQDTQDIRNGGWLGLAGCALLALLVVVM